jgi:ClpP class serine protease
VSITRPLQKDFSARQYDLLDVRAEMTTLQGTIASLSSLSPQSRSFERLVAGQEQDGAPIDTSAYWVWREEEEDEEDEEDCLAITADGVAVVQIVGVLVPWERRWWMGSSYASTPQVKDAFEQCLEGFLAGTIKRVFIYADSPGGIVSGMNGCADALLALRRAGCVVWVAGPQMCSCMYWLASQASRIFLAKDGMTACIGTLLLLTDTSKMYQEMGVESLRITSTGAETYKGAGSWGTQITKDQRAMFARMCDEAQLPFTIAIADGRGIKLSEAKTWSDGQPWGALNALEMGMIDEIADPEEVFSRISNMGIDLDARAEDCACEEDDD